MSRECFLMDKYALHAALDPELTFEIIDVDPASERLQTLPPDDEAADDPLSQKRPDGIDAAPVDEAD